MSYCPVNIRPVLVATIPGFLGDRGLFHDPSQKPTINQRTRCGGRDIPATQAHPERNNPERRQECLRHKAISNCLNPLTADSDHVDREHEDRHAKRHQA